MTPPNSRKKSAPDWSAASQSAGATAESAPYTPQMQGEGEGGSTSQLRPRRAVRPEPARYARTYRLTEDTLNTIEALLEQATESGERTSRERIVERAISVYAQQQADQR